MNKRVVSVWTNGQKDIGVDEERFGQTEVWANKNLDSKFFFLENW